MMISVTREKLQKDPCGTTNQTVELQLQRKCAMQRVRETVKPTLFARPKYRDVK